MLREFSASALPVLGNGLFEAERLLWWNPGLSYALCVDLSVAAQVHSLVGCYSQL